MVRIFIEIERYRTPRGNPACEGDLSEGEICIFIDDALPDEEGTGYCKACGTVLATCDSEEGFGVCVPCVGCPVWSEHAEVIISAGEEQEG